MVTSLIRPSYQNNFYSRERGGIPANPGLWHSLVGAWLPELGNSGISILRDMSGYSNHGAMTDIKGSDWQMTPQGYAIDYPDTSDVIDITGSGASGNVLHIPSDKRHSWVVKFKTGSSLTGTLVSNRDSAGSNKEYQFWISGTDLVYSASGGSQIIVSLAANTTYIAGLSSKDGLLKGYLNGIEVLSSSTLLTYSEKNINMAIGARWQGYPTTGYQFNNLIGAVYRWNRTLTSQDQAIMARDILAPFQLRQRIFKSPAEVVGGGLTAGSLALSGVGI